DGNSCTVGDTCQAGLCRSGPPRDADVDGHVDGLCGGDDCNDADALVWSAPLSVTGMSVASGSPTPLAWDSQAIPTGPETASDLASGVFGGGTPLDFTTAVCLQPAGGPSFSDARPNPPFGSVVWYLVRDRNSCGIGSYGSAQEDATLTACP